MIFFGLLQLGLGLLSLLLFGFMVVTFTVIANAHQPGMPAVQPRAMIFSGAIYVVFGALLVTLGIGSMLARRWARDLSLLVSIAWLILGTFTTLFMAAVMPRFMPQTAPTFVVTCMIVMFAIFGIAIPLSLVLFYRSPNVHATCLALDPVPRWTETVPLPLLGLALWTAFHGVAMLGTSAYAVLPLANDVLTGAPAVAIFVALGAVLLYVAWGLYRRSMVAWWIGIAYGVLVLAYSAIVFPRVDYNKVFAAMHVPKTPGMPDFTGFYSNPVLLALIGLFYLVYFGYFVYVRKSLANV